MPLSPASRQRSSSSKCRNVACADVLADVELVAREVLEDHADAPAQCRRLPLGEVESVEADAAGVGRVEARQQLDQRGLA